MNPKSPEKWPVIEGRYKIGNPNSCVAVCTLFSLDLIDRIKPDNIAIIGKVVTENIGVERIIKNIVTNPNIRYLIICGQEPEGHWVGQALNCIIESGIDSDNRIIGAMGAMPYLRNNTKEEIEQFRKQIKIIDLIGCEDVDKIQHAVNDCLSNNPGTFDSKINIKQTKEIIASHNEDEFKPDESGWFVISIDRQDKRIVVEHYKDYGDKAKLNSRIVGKTAEEICATIARLNLVSRLDHAAYLGRELQKAEIALKQDIEYEQDKNLSHHPPS